MIYGETFFCCNPDGSKSDKILFPKLQPFYYPDKAEGWLLLEDFSITYNGYKLTALKGFDYDGASINRIFWTLIGSPMDHDIIVGSMFHDLLYCVHLPEFPRCETDGLLKYLMGVYYADKAKQTAVYNAVRLFGNNHWTQTPEDIAKYRNLIKIEQA